MADIMLPEGDFARLSDNDLGLRKNGQSVLSEATEPAPSLVCQSELYCPLESCPEACAAKDEDDAVSEPRSGCHETDFFDLTWRGRSAGE